MVALKTNFASLRTHSHGSRKDAQGAKVQKLITCH